MCSNGTQLGLPHPHRLFSSVFPGDVRKPSICGSRGVWESLRGVVKTQRAENRVGVVIISRLPCECAVFPLQPRHFHELQRTRGPACCRRAHRGGPPQPCAVCCVHPSRVCMCTDVHMHTFPFTGTADTVVSNRQQYSFEKLNDKSLCHFPPTYTGIVNVTFFFSTKHVCNGATVSFSHTL